MSQQISFQTFSESAAENYESYFVPAIGAPLAAHLVESQRFVAASACWMSRVGQASSRGMHSSVSATVEELLASTAMPGCSPSPAPPHRARRIRLVRCQR
jgi:hypothetical protein